MIISLFIYAPTKLNFKHMGPIVGLDVHCLIFMAVIQWPFLVSLDGEMEDRDACFHDWYEVRRIPSFLCDYICAPETVLRATAARNKNRAVVDGNG